MIIIMQCTNSQCCNDKKKDFKSKSIWWTRVLVCQRCGYYNSNLLFKKK
jgi:hypothetical protein